MSSPLGSKAKFARTWQRPKIPVPKGGIDRRIFYSTLSSLLFSVLLILVFWKKLPAQIPIFYSRPWGEEQLGEPVYLLLPAVLGLIFLIFNLLISKNSSAFVKQIMLIGAASASLLASITIVRIVVLLL